MADLPERPERGFLFWLGRQVGYVARAIKVNVGGPPVVYRKDTVEELPHPADPDLKLRRTVIDEVLVKPDEDKAPPKGSR
jgi:hypothetical protein